MLTWRCLSLLCICASALVLACGGEAPTGVPVRVLEITVATSGDEPDADGYTVQIDAEPARPLASPAAFQHRDISPGDHTVYVGGVAENCAVQGANPRTVSVPAEGTTTITIEIVCAARRGSVLVTTRTQGPSPYPSGHTIAVDGAESAVIDTGRVLIGGIAPGRHVIQLRGIAPHCTTVGNPRTVTVRAVEVTPVEFHVTCVGLHGILEITTSPIGHQNPADFAYRLDGGQPLQLGSAAVLTREVDAGTHLVELLRIPPNCRVLGPNPRPVEIPAGGRGRVNFTIHCDPFAAGNLAVSVTTTGAATDTDGYELLLTGGTRYQLEPRDRVVISNLQHGYHYISLQGVSGNCRVDGEVERLVFVAAAATAAVEFVVACAEAG
jgi:hypothetical protein